jgi:hypothetical protein
MFNLKSKVLAIAATLALAGGVGTAGVLAAGTASAATPSCGPACVDVFSQQFGTHTTPNYAVDVFRQGEKTGQPIILFRTADYDPALDWTFAFEGTAADFYDAGLLGSAVALHYGCTAGSGAKQFADCSAGVDDPAVENEYAPFGVDSGLCMGVAAVAVSGEGVTLQPCGTGAGTVWILDTADSPATLANGYIPLINGTDTNFSQPFVLTYPANSVPTDKPRPQLYVTNLSGESQGTPPGPVLGTVNVNQLWGADFGVLK